MWKLLARTIMILGVLLPLDGVADPLIAVNKTLVSNGHVVEPGESFSSTIVVTNSGDFPLTVSKVGTIELSAGPPGWLSVSDTCFVVLAGEENAIEFEVLADASAYDLSCNLIGEVFLKSDAANEDSLTIDVIVTLWDSDPSVSWALLGTDPYMYDPYHDPDSECVGLALSSHGAYGVPGWRGMHLDYWESGLECGTRFEDHVYLNSGSPFVLIHDGDSVSLTTSIYQSGQVKDYYWQPAPNSQGFWGGLTGGYGSYYYLSTGRLLNRDGRMAMERTYYAPRAPAGYERCILVCTKFYSGDGQPHSHVTVGSVADWDIPSDMPAVNSTHVSTWMMRTQQTEYVYAQGTDTVGSVSCQLNAHRFGTEAFLHGYYRVWDGYWLLDEAPWGAWAGPQPLLRDTALARDGSPLDPPQLDARAWWNEIAAHDGCSGDPVQSNQAIWLTYYHDFELAADDTLRFWSVLTTVRDGSQWDLTSQVGSAHKYFHLAIEQYCYGCCVGIVGDANGYGGEEPTIGDVSAIIDLLFISGQGASCLDEADVNQSGLCTAEREDVTISDVSMLIDYLFITGPSLGLPPCYW